MKCARVNQMARRAVSVSLGLCLLLACSPAFVALADLVGDGVSPMRSACGYGTTESFSQVRNPDVREASALVASQQWPGIYWTLNDAKNTPTLFAFDEEGHPRGTYQVVNASNVDWESLQLGPDADGGFALYIGDTGDNDYTRPDIVIYRVPEPIPLPVGVSPKVAQTAPATAFHVRFPGLPGNVEAMLVHPTTGEVVLIAKEVTGVSLVYGLPSPLDSRSTMVADLLDVLDVRALSATSTLVTDGAVSSDSSLVVLRTYSHALLWELTPKAPLTSIWSQQPAVYPIQDSPKGEGITFRPSSADLILIGEGASPTLYQSLRHC